MTLIVAELLAKLGVDDTGFAGAMQGAQGQYQATARSASQMAQSVEKSAAKVQSARAAEQTAAVNVKVAEEALNKLRASGSATTLELERAEARLQTTLAQQKTRSVQAAEAARGLSAAQRAQSSASDRVASSNQKAVTSTNNLAQAANVAKGALAAMGIGFSINQVVQGLTQSVQAARSLGAQTNQLNVIFGAGKGQIEAWGRSASTTMRMSQREAQGAAIQFATFGRAMGLSGEKLVSFSTEQAKLAADLASFQGIPVAEAIQAMGSAYAGETETMRQYGVLIDDNTLKQTALAHGMQITGGNLTQVQKSQAIYLAMQEQLAYVNGDVERSNGKFGASLKTLTANLEETQAVVGQKLIPVVQPFVDLLAGPGLGAVEGIASAVGAAGSAFGSLPGPVQAALAGVVAWKLGTTVAMRVAGDQITGLRDRATGAFSNMQQSMSNMQRAAAVSGRSMSNFGAGIAVIGRNIPILDRMRTSFIEAAAGADRFPRSAGLAASAMTGMKGAASGLLGVMGGPWGLAIAGATAALGVWMAKKQEDQAASEAAKNATQEWADVLTKSNGAIDSNVKKFAADKLAKTDALETAKKLGISTEELTNKVLEGRDAYDAWYAAMYRKGKDSGKWSESDMAGMTGEVQKIAEQFDAGKDKARLMAEATGDVKVSFDGSTQAAGAMSEAMTEFEESTGGAASKVDKLSKALNTLRDDRLTEEEALQESTRAIADLAEAWTKVDSAAVKADGSINFDTPEAVAKYGDLQDAAVSLGKTYDQTAASAMEHARAERMGPGEALDYVQGKVAHIRQSLIDQATAAGVSAEAAERMADRYLGVPSEILTKLQLQGGDAAIAKLNELQIKGAQPVQMKYTMIDNTPAVRAKLDYLKINYSEINGKLVIHDEDIPKVQEALKDLGVQTEALPEGWVKITDTSPENLEHLRELGIRTQSLPDGTIVINPDDAEFWKHITEAQKPGRKDIYVRTIQEQTAYGQSVIAGLQQAAQDQGLADGGVTEYASGGLRPAGVPSMPDQAVIEKGRGRGLVRWAEGETWWESYIPGAPSKRRRSTAILSETARRFGYGLVPFDAMRGVLSILQRGDYTSSLSRVGIEEDSAIVDFLMKRRAGQSDSPLTSLQKDIAALMTGGGALLRGQYDGVLSKRFNIEEDSPWIAQFFGPRGPSMMRAYADGAITGGTVQLGNISGEGITSTEQQSMWDAVRSKFGDAVLSSATRTVQTEGHADYHNAGRAIDISGPSMGSIASWIAENYPDSMELIHSPFGHNIKDGKDVGDGMAFYGADTMAGHENHVHWALGHDATAGANGAGAQQIQDVTLTSSSSRDDVARKIIAEGRKRGYTDDQIKAVLATAIQESNLDPGASGGGGAWHGIFQQDESYEGRDDPNTNISGFYDRLDEKRAADPDADIYDQIFWLQQRPGESSAANAVANGRGGYMDEIKSKDGDAAKMLADLGPSVGNGTTDSTSGIGNGTQVYVTGGRLDSIGSGYTPSTSTSSTSSDSTASSPSTTTTSSPERKRLFTLGGNRWPFYNGSPEQPKVEKSSPDTTSKTTKGPAAPSESSIAAAQAAVEKAKRSQGEAVEKQRIAEMRLDEVRANPKAKPSQIAAAEESVARAKNAVVDATDKQRIAEMRLQELQNKKSAANAPATPPVKRLHGGTIPGTGRGDIIPMMGEPGEEVIRRPVAEMPGMRGALKHLNATGRWPEFHADGGTVGGFTSGFGGYTDPAVAKVGILDHAPGYYLEQLYRLGVAGYGGAAMAASAIGADGSFQGLSTGSASFPILDDIAQKLDEVIKEGRVGSIGIYVGEGGQIVVEDMGKLRQTQDKAVGDAMMRSAAMRA